ncbi:MAG: hypothetical protein KGZ38_00035 [Erysipelothrix sp.]|nr:hypothetical protein [Erysipelothrix sp.]
MKNPYPSTYDSIVCSLKQKQFSDAYPMIINLMTHYPNEPWAHNLLGCWYEMQGEIILAMKHYRAAYAISPSYVASRQNVVEFQMHARPVNHIYF